MNKKENSVEVMSLRQTDYKDNDAIVNAISREGVYYTFFARGIRKPTSKNASALQPFVYSQIQYFEGSKDMYLLKSAQPLKTYYDNFSDYEQMIAAHIVLDVIADVSRFAVEGDSKIFKLLIDSLEAIVGSDQHLFLSIFFAKLMRLIGLELVTDKCAVCSRQQVNYISVEHGGFVCHHCLSDNNQAIYDLEILKFFRLIHHCDYEHAQDLEIPMHQKQEILTIMYEFYHTYTGLRIKNIKQFIDIDVVKSYSQRY